MYQIKILDATIYNRVTKRNLHFEVKNRKTVLRSLRNRLYLGLGKVDHVILCMEHAGVYCIVLTLFLEENYIKYTFVSPSYIKSTCSLF